MVRVGWLELDGECLMRETSMRELDGELERIIMMIIEFGRRERNERKFAVRAFKVEHCIKEQISR